MVEARLTEAPKIKVLEVSENGDGPFGFTEEDPFGTDEECNLKVHFSQVNYAPVSGSSQKRVSTQRHMDSVGNRNNNSERGALPMSGTLKKHSPAIFVNW